LDTFKEKEPNGII